jgi:hypothetical protein
MNAFLKELPALLASSSLPYHGVELSGPCRKTRQFSNEKDKTIFKEVLRLRMGTDKENGKDSAARRSQQS